MGKWLLTCPFRFSSLMTAVASIYQSGVRAICACEKSKVPIAPMGFSHDLRFCLQGGGVYVQGGSVTFSSCTITGNTAHYVRAHAQKFPSPRWEFLLTGPLDSHLSIRIDIWFYQGYVRASHACKLPIAPMGFSHVLRLRLQGGGVYIEGGTVSFSSCSMTGNSAQYVRAHAQKFPSPPWETHVLLVFTVRRCLCLFRHRHNDVLLDHRQHSSWIGACSCSKLPIGMGKLLTRLP